MLGRDEENGVLGIAIHYWNRDQFLLTSKIKIGGSFAVFSLESLFIVRKEGK